MGNFSVTQEFVEGLQSLSPCLVEGCRQFTSFLGWHVGGDVGEASVDVNREFFTAARCKGDAGGAFVARAAAQVLSGTLR